MLKKHIFAFDYAETCLEMADLKENRKK